MKRIIVKIINFVLELFPHLGLKYRVNYFLKHSWDNIDHNGIPFSKDVCDNFRIFLSDGEINDLSFIERLKRDIISCYLLYGITPDEYFLHGFQHQSEKYKATILSRKKKDEICCAVLGKDASFYFNQLKDKWFFYTMAKPYFKRDVCRLEEESDFIAMKEFCAKHTRFIAKPRLQASGIGVHVVDLNQNEYGGIRELFDHYRFLDDGKWMFEELIIQDSSMAAWHESSVNTIRVPSIRTKQGCKVLLPLFRTGKNGNLVDNCHNDGGLMAVPDANTGILISDGYDVFTNVVEKHPNSGMKFKGWQVPRWDELLKISSELHQSLPEYHKYVGFDFALTPNGWVVIEGNWGNFPHQVCVHHGIKKEFIKLMKS